MYVLTRIFVFCKFQTYIMHNLISSQQRKDHNKSIGATSNHRQSTIGLSAPVSLYLWPKMENNIKDQTHAHCVVN